MNLKQIISTGVVTATSVAFTAVPLLFLNHLFSDFTLLLLVCPAFAFSGVFISGRFFLKHNKERSWFPFSGEMLGLFLVGVISCLLLVWCDFWWDDPLHVSRRAKAEEALVAYDLAVTQGNTPRISREQLEGRSYSLEFIAIHFLLYSGYLIAFAFWLLRPFFVIEHWMKSAAFCFFFVVVWRLMQRFFILL